MFGSCLKLCCEVVGKEKVGLGTQKVFRLFVGLGAAGRS